MRLVDTDIMMELVDRLPFRNNEDVKNFIEVQPTVEAEPIRHGRWIEPNDKGVVSYDKHAYAECSVCHTAEYLARGKRYCPNCGARMDLPESIVYPQVEGITPTVVTMDAGDTYSTGHNERDTEVRV